MSSVRRSKEESSITATPTLRTAMSTGVKVPTFGGLERPIEVGSTGLEEVRPRVSPTSLDLVDNLLETSGRRLDTPVRKRFARCDEDQTPPLAQLVSTGGRGGAVAVKLYLALIWRCSAAPFDTDISARKWAALLDLEDPTHKGARRVTAALQRLADCKLISLEERRGEPSKIMLLDESGSGRAYSLPSTSYVLAKPAEKPDHIYFKVPVALWTSGHLQDMSAAALAMLLAVLAETTEPGRKVWWSTELFPAAFGISPAMRARGTRELVQRRLLLVQKQLVQDSPKRDFGKERVRNLYQVINEAEPRPVETPTTTPEAKRPRRSAGRPKRAASTR